MRNNAKNRQINLVKQPAKMGATRIVNLSSFQTPSVKEVYNKDYVLYDDGDGGDYFQNLIDAYMGSPTNARCINGISDMIYERGGHR